MEGLSKASRCLFSTMPAAVPEDTEMNKAAVPGLKAHTVWKRGKDVDANKYINALLEICVESKKNQMESGFPETQRYGGQYVEEAGLMGVAFIPRTSGH